MISFKDMDWNDNHYHSFQSIVNHTHLNLNIQKIKKRWNEIISGTYTTLAIDYDGTLQDSSIRTGSADEFCISQLCRLGLNSNIQIIIATGRKSSIMEFGRELVSLGMLKFDIILGNGMKIVSFPSEKEQLIAEPFNDDEFNTIKSLLEKSELNEKEIVSSKYMIRIFYDDEQTVNKMIQKVVALITFASPTLRVSHSGHNIEIIPKGVCKEKGIIQLIGTKEVSEVIAIGDSCSEYGNDHRMLSKFPSFSVGKSSINSIQWTLPVLDLKGNILDGPKATGYLLSNMVI